MARVGNPFVGIRRLAKSPIVQFAVFLLLVTTIVGMVFVQRSFLVEAETSYAELTFVGENVWNFPAATVCNPKEPDVSAGRTGDEICNPVLFEPPEEAWGEVTVNWSCGARVAVQSDVDGDLVVTVLGLATQAERPEGCDVSDADPPEADARGPFGEDGEFAPADAHGIVRDSIIVVRDRDWRATGALPFQAAATVGEDIGPGAVHFLQSGRWEARQTSPVHDYVPFAHAVTEMVKKGELSLGAEVQVWDYRKGRPATMWGHITPTPDDFDNSLAGFDLVMLSSPGKTELRLAHFGFREPATIRPDWVDTAVNSPLFLAMFALLSLIAVILQIMKDTGELRRKTKTGAPPE